MYKVIIVIPIYQNLISNNDRISLRQLISLCRSDYEICFAAPKKIIKKNYLKTLNLGNTFEFEFFENSFFKSLLTYNKLLTSEIFYRRFKYYDYLLIHHLDAFMFKNEIQYWCSQGFGSIGAPIYYFNGTSTPHSYFCNGNGGFCLRHISSCLNVLKSNKIVYGLEDICKDLNMYNWKGKILRAIYYLDMFSSLGNRSNPNFNRIRVNEDLFWSFYVPRTYKWFKIPDRLTAASFSIEFNGENLLKELDDVIPMGCHGWNREILIDFFQPLIEQYKLD